MCRIVIPLNPIAITLPVSQVVNRTVKITLSFLNIRINCRASVVTLITSDLHDSITAFLNIMIARILFHFITNTLIDGMTATKALLHNFGSWNGAWNHSKESALVDLMRERTDDFLKENKDVILEAAAKNLSERLARSKKGKELLEGLEKEV